MRSNILDMLNSMSGTDRLPQDLHDEMVRTEMLKQKMEQLNRRTYGFGKAPVSPAVSPAQALMGQERQYAGDMSRKYGVDVLPVTESWANSTNTLPVQAGGRTMLMGRNQGTPASGGDMTFSEWKERQAVNKFNQAAGMQESFPGVSQQPAPMTPEFRERRQAMAASTAADAESKRAAMGGVSEADRWNNVQARAKAKQDRTMPEGLMEALTLGPQYAASMAKIRADGEIAAGGDRNRLSVAETQKSAALEAAKIEAQSRLDTAKINNGPGSPAVMGLQAQLQQIQAAIEQQKVANDQWKATFDQTAKRNESETKQKMLSDLLAPHQAIASNPNSTPQAVADAMQSIDRISKDFGVPGYTQGQPATPGEAPAPAAPGSAPNRKPYSPPTPSQAHDLERSQFASGSVKLTPESYPKLYEAMMGHATGEKADAVFGPDWFFSNSQDRTTKAVEALRNAGYTDKEIRGYLESNHGDIVDPMWRDIRTLEELLSGAGV